MRKKKINVGQVDRSQQRRWDAEISAYRDARRQGVQPMSSQMPDIKAAMELSDRVGKPFNATEGNFS